MLESPTSALTTDDLEDDDVTACFVCQQCAHASATDSGESDNSDSGRRRCTKSMAAYLRQRRKERQR